MAFKCCWTCSLPQKAALAVPQEACLSYFGCSCQMLQKPAVGHLQFLHHLVQKMLASVQRLQVTVPALLILVMQLTVSLGVGGQHH